MVMASMCPALLCVALPSLGEGEVAGAHVRELGDKRGQEQAPPLVAMDSKKITFAWLRGLSLYDLPAGHLNIT